MAAITAMKSPKSSSSLRRPYLSIIRKVKVSKIVMMTPAHTGSLWRKEAA